MKKLLIVIATTSFLFGLYLRLQGVFTNSFAFTYDVGRDLIAVSNLVYFHKVSLIGFTTGLPGVFYGPWWYWILSPAFLITRGNPQGIALYMALFGLGTVLIGFLIGKQFIGFTFGLLFATFLMVSPSLIALSSQIWNPNIIPFFLLPLVWLLATAYKKKKLSLFSGFGVGILLSLIMDLEIVFGLLLIFATIITAIVFLRKYLAITAIGAFVLGFLFILSPRLLFDTRHQFLMTKSLIKLASPEPGSGSFHVLSTLWERAQMFFHLWNFTLANNQTAAISIIVILGVATPLVWRKFDSSSRFLVGYSFIAIVTYILGLTFFRHMIFDHYTVGLPVFYLLITSVIFYSLLKEAKPLRYLAAVVLIIVLWFTINPITVLTNIRKPLWIGDASVYRNQLQVIDYIYQKASGKDFKINVYTPPVYDYTYQYLFSWYGKRKYNMIPVKQSQLAFFILEPDNQYPERLANWLAVRQNDGKIISQKTFPSGIIVQTRK